MLLHTTAILWYSVWLAWNHTIVWSFHDLHVTINFCGTFYDSNVFIYDFLWFPCFLYGSEPGLHWDTHKLTTWKTEVFLLARTKCASQPELPKTHPELIVAQSTISTNQLFPFSFHVSMVPKRSSHKELLWKFSRQKIVSCFNMEIEM